jgi:hypothetical protein
MLAIWAFHEDNSIAGFALPAFERPAREFFVALIAS